MGCLGWLWLSPDVALAQRNVDVSRFVPAFDQDSFLGLQGTRTPGHLKLNFALWGDYASRLLAIDPAGADAVDAVEHRIVGRVMAQLGLGKRIALGVDVPVVPWQSGERTGIDRSDIATTAFADPRLSARVRLIGEATDERVLRRDGPGLALQATTALPLGASDSYVGEGAVRTQLSLLGDFQIFGAGLGASVDWLHRFSPKDLFAARIRDELAFAFAVKLPVPSHPTWIPMIETRVTTDAGAPFDKQHTTAVEGDLALRVLVEPYAFVFAVGTGLTNGVGTPSVRAIFGLQWTPRAGDSDGDGIDDDDDGCAHLPEDLDGFDDADGCPDPDNDNDMINDVDDLCPNVEALEGQDDDEDGCTDP